MEFIRYILSFFIPPHKGDFYYLALLKNSNVPSGYQIHGLWSNYADGHYPSYCKKVNFNMKELDSISCELKTYWPSRDGDNEKFYNHEYKKSTDPGKIGKNKKIDFLISYWETTITKGKCRINVDHLSKIM